MTESQVYEKLRGKTKGYCSRVCGNPKELHYKKCIVCGDIFSGQKKQIQVKKVCSVKCNGVLVSSYMKENNPMKKKEVRDKVIATLKRIKHKPFIQGGNGRGATNQQLKLYNALSKIDDSWQMEFIVKSGKDIMNKYNAATHYKIDIASYVHKIAIEVDGASHKSKKVKKWDKKKEMILNSKGWIVLRFWNEEVMEDTSKCVQTVMSMI